MLTVGGTGVGEALLRKAIDAWPLVYRERPDACCVAVAGPRIDASLSATARGDWRSADTSTNFTSIWPPAILAVVQGGLSTTMELTVNRRPFIYVPIRDHCEQIYHVAHRLNRYRAGTRLDYDALTPNHWCKRC